MGETIFGSILGYLAFGVALCMGASLPISYLVLTIIGTAAALVLLPIRAIGDRLQVDAV